MEQLEEELTCPVCCSLFEDPRVLLCSHSFCKKCLEGLVEGSRSQIYRNPLKCPTCRKETPHNGANSLQVNYSLRGIVEKFSRIKAMPPTSECKQHCGQPLNIFCATDSELICGICATSGDHGGHKFTSLDDAHADEKAALPGLLRGLESWQSADIRSRLDTLRAGKKKALQAVSRDAEKVADYFDKLLAALECKKSEMLSDFETLKLAVMQAHDPRMDRLSAALEHQRSALELAEAVKSVTEPLRFLQQMQELRGKIKSLEETQQQQPPLRPDGDKTPASVRDFDVKKWDSLRLSEIDKISVPHESGGYRTGTPGVTRFRRIMWVLALLLIAALVLALLMHHDLPARAGSALQPLATAFASQCCVFAQSVGELWQRVIDTDHEFIDAWFSSWEIF